MTRPRGAPRRQPAAPEHSNDLIKSPHGLQRMGSPLNSHLCVPQTPVLETVNPVITSTTLRLEDTRNAGECFTTRTCWESDSEQYAERHIIQT